MEVTAAEGACIVTLPLKTADDRFIDVFVERMRDSKSFMYVHDGGKNTAELFAQGVHQTDTQERMLKGIAAAHGAQFQDGRFHILCKNETEVQAAVLSIGQCAALAMVDVVSHLPNIEDEPLKSRVFRALTAWRPSYVEIKRGYVAVGKTGVDHSFDFVTVPVRARARTVALKLLPPSVGASWQVSRYGFLVLDLGGKKEGRWPRLAIVSKAEEWSPKNIGTIESMSEDVIVLKSGEEDQLDRILPRKMARLTEAA